MDSDPKKHHPLTYEQLDKVAFPLANRFYKQAREKGKTQGSDEVHVAKLNGQLVAAVRLCAINPNGDFNKGPREDRSVTSEGHSIERKDDSTPLLLRSLAVLPELRRQRLGQQFMTYLAEQLESRVCWCYPFSWLEGFYEQSGFISVAASDAPEFIRTPYEAYRRQGRDILIMVRTERELVDL